jgi:hypothetical protein
MADPALLSNPPSGVPANVLLAVVPAREEPYVPCTPETAECTSPQLSERGHDRD